MADYYAPSPNDQVRILETLVRLTDVQRIDWVQSPDRGDAYDAVLGSYHYVLQTEDRDGVPPYELLVIHTGKDQRFAVSSSTAENRADEVHDLLTQLYRKGVSRKQDESVAELLRELEGIENEPPF